MDEAEMYFDNKEIDDDDDSLVKVNIVDDNNPNETTCAAIPQEYYERIVRGESTLKKEIDKDGNVQFVLIDIIEHPIASQIQTECSSTNESTLSTLNKVINNTTNLHSMGNIINNNNHKQKSIDSSKYREEISEVDGNSAEDGLNVGEGGVIKGDEYLITEYPSMDNFFVVIISDCNGDTVFEKAGQIGDTLMLDLCGNTISYLISGPGEDGSIRQTNVIVDQSETEKGGDLVESQHAEQQIMMDEGEINGTHNMHEPMDNSEEEYIISEESVLLNDEHQQMIQLSDKHHNVLDTKYGIKGETVKLQLTDKAFEYSIQGPMDNGEPIMTTFLINKTDDNDDEDQHHIDHHSPSEVEDPATQWCPPDLTKEDYGAIREAARHVAASLESASVELLPYSEQLGSLTAYQELVALVERYKSRAEERRSDLQALRRHSKLYMAVNPSKARKLTRVEWVRNEAAAQVCRYVPALLFHKRKLYECALEVVERSGLLFGGDTGSINSRNNNIEGVKEEFSDDNRPLKAMVVTEEMAVQRNALANTTSAVVARQQQQHGGTNVGSYMSGGDMSAGGNNPFSQGFPSFGKRDLQLTGTEETAIKNSADRLQEELYQYPIKSKDDCQSVELHIREELGGLQNLLEGGVSEVEQAHEYMRETSAVNGRFHPTQRGRHMALSPYDVAVNEAAYHLARNNIGLLTYRKVLTDLARKVVRATGCNFRHNTMGDKKEYNAANLWLYNQDNIPELDLSSAVKVLSDPLEGLSSNSVLHSSYVPIIEETLVKSDIDDEDNEDDDDDGMAYRPREFEEKELLGNIGMECMSERNILDGCAICCHTGTDDLKKVRILDLHDCSFTSIMPIDINYCYNLVELNLSDNALQFLPRCLFLPNLIKLNLRNNRFITVPLLEQFTKLCSVEIDDKIVRKLNRESLAFFCIDLQYINNEKFDGFISDDFNATFLEAKTHIETMVQNRWEEDLSSYFKKGVTKSESQKVIETLVLSIRERRIYNEQNFLNFKDLIARRVAENFLDSKIIDDDDEEEYKEKFAEEIDTDEDDTENIGDTEVSIRCPRTTTLRYQRKNEFDNQIVEKGQILLNDEPLDRLTNVVGQALRSGKTVVYSVMRTAARQPGGDLIPVGGGDNNNNTQNNSSYLLSTKKLLADDSSNEKNTSKMEDDMSMRTKPGPASYKKRKYGIVQSPSRDMDDIDDLCTRETVQRIIDEVMEKVESFNTNVKRKVGRPRIIKQSTIAEKFDKKHILENHKKTMFKVPKTLQDITSPEAAVTVNATNTVALDTNFEPTVIIKKDKRPSEEMAQKIENIVRGCNGPVTTAKMRELLGLSTRGRPSLYITEASMRTYKKYGQEMPETPFKVKVAAAGQLDDDDMAMEALYDLGSFEENKPHSKIKFATRVSNQFKKFHPLGVRDLNESALSSENEDGRMKESKDMINDIEYTPTPKHSKDSPTLSRTERSSSNISDLNSESSFINELRRSQVEKDRQLAARVHKQPPPPVGVVVSLPVSSVFSTTKGGGGASTNNNNFQGTKIPDYDPLYFIRCHARDNNPHDAATKVWRCAFEPNPNNPYMETTSMVATCGGECVCLIDCNTGKVMKRFKSREEEFYTVAWTTLEMAAGHNINILAAAGKLKDIRLLHPDQLVCYAEMKGHEQEVACMTFHPRLPTVLFSGDAMANILVWDIGVPSAPDYTTRYQLLQRLQCPRAHLNPVLNIVVMPSYDSLVAGCEDGVFVWQFPEFRKTPEGDTGYTRLPDFEVKVPTHQEPCFDGLARLSENTLLVKCVEEGDIFTLNFPQIIQHYKARKFDDNSRVVADAIGCLRWQITDEIYINVTAQMNLCTVLCGDNEGTIWLYNMNKEVREENHCMKFKSMYHKKLEWPECRVENPKQEEGEAGGEEGADINSGGGSEKGPVVNCVEMSSDGTFVVAVTDNNLVCIWSTLSTVPPLSS